MVTRKLRRRPHDPLPTVEKRRKLTPLSSLVYILDEGEVDEDLKIIFKVQYLVCVWGGGGGGEGTVQATLNDCEMLIVHISGQDSVISKKPSTRFVT